MNILLLFNDGGHLETKIINSSISFFSISDAPRLFCARRLNWADLQ
jgi:hypothetical protein